MCGILGVYINAMSDEVIRNLYNLFANQKSRGTQGAGISINNKKLIRYRTTDPYNLFNVYNKEIWDNVRTKSRVLFHHRYPTSTENEPRFNHPIANEDRTIHVIHNGVIINDDAMYKGLLKKGHKFDTWSDDKEKFTDSEVIVHVFEDGLDKHKGDVTKALQYMYDTVSGSFAVALQMSGDDKIYLVKHNNPIMISKDSDDNYYFSSELGYKTELTRIAELEEGEIGVLSFAGYEKIAKMKAKPVKYVYFTDKPKKGKNGKHKKHGRVVDTKVNDFGGGFGNAYDYGVAYDPDGNPYYMLDGWKRKRGY